MKGDGERLARLSAGVFVRVQIRKGSLKCTEESYPKCRSKYSFCPKEFVSWGQHVAALRSVQAALAAAVAHLCRGDRRQTLLAGWVQF